MARPKRPKGPTKQRQRPVVYFCEKYSMHAWYAGRWRGVVRVRWFWGRHPYYGDADPAQEWFNVPQKPNVEVAGAGGKLPSCFQGKWGTQYPFLAGWLCDAAYEDDTPVGDVRLVLRRIGTVFTGELKVQDGSLKLRVQEKSPDGVLVALETLLKATPPPWEPDAYAIGGQAKKKK